MPRSPDDGAQLLNLLIAYPYLNKRLLEVVRQAIPRTRFLLDSGAFTAWKAGRSIKLDDYCRFLDGLAFEPWRYFTLDVIGDPKATLKNYDEMLRRGYKPVPIFTRGDDTKMLEHYYASSDVVGVGGLVGTAGNTGFVNGIMKKIRKRRVHLLGFTRISFLKAYRPYMCDTSSWEYGARMGTFKLYDRAGRGIVLHKKDFAKRPSERVLEVIAGYGVDPQVLSKEAAWHGGYSVNRTLNAASAVRLSLDVQRNLGTLMFSAATTEHAVKLLLRGLEADLKRGTP